MTISEFAKSRGVDPQAVNRYLNRHEDLKFKCFKDGKNIILTQAVLDVLEKQYPLPKPVTVVEGVPEQEHIEVLKRLDDAKTVILDMQTKLFDVKMLLSERDAEHLLLEEKKNTLEKSIVEKSAEIETLKSQLSEREKEIRELQNRTLLDYLFRKKKG